MFFFRSVCHKVQNSRSVIKSKIDREVILCNMQRLFRPPKIIFLSWAKKQVKFESSFSNDSGYSPLQWRNTSGMSNRKKYQWMNELKHAFELLKKPWWITGTRTDGPILGGNFCSYCEHCDDSIVGLHQSRRSSGRLATLTSFDRYVCFT